MDSSFPSLGHFNIGKIDTSSYFPYISRFRRSCIKDCRRSAPQHEHPIITLLGCVCWSSVADCDVSISMVNGLRTPCKHECGLALLQLGGGTSLNRTGSSRAVATCNVRKNTKPSSASSVIRCSAEQMSSDKGWAPLTNGRTSRRLWRTCDGCSQTQHLSRQTSLNHWVGKGTTINKI